MNAIEIDETDRPAGSHWGSVKSPTDGLRDVLQMMEAILDGEREDELEGFALDAWWTERRRADDSGAGEIQSRTLVVGFGGPNVYAECDGDRVTYSIHWSGEWKARTFDPAAVDVFERFFDAYYGGA